MATEQDILLSTRSAPARRTALKNIVRLLPAVVIIAATLNTSSCGSPGLLSSVNGGSGSPTSTKTPPGTGSLAFVTNYNDGKVSSFTRSTTTGLLKRTGQVTAGGKTGPRGVIASPSGSFLYVANIGDGNIYEFSINPTNGTLTPVSPASVSGGTKPDELAINSAGTLLWVTGAAGTVTSYKVNTSTGQITSSGSTTGFGAPFGIVVHPTLAVLYVSDPANGVIWPMNYNTSTGVLSQNSPAVRSSDPLAISPVGIAIDSGGNYLYVTDKGNGEVSTFLIDNTGVTCGQAGCLTPEYAFANSNIGDAPIGIGLAVNTSIEYLFTANSGGDSVSSFMVSGTTLTTPPTLAAGYNGPIGLVADPQNLFVYTADYGNGTVGQAIINGTCGSSICAGSTVATESPANANSGPFGITLAQ